MIMVHELMFFNLKTLNIFDFSNPHNSSLTYRNNLESKSKYPELKMTYLTCVDEHLDVGSSFTSLLLTMLHKMSEALICGSALAKHFFYS